MCYFVFVSFPGDISTGVDCLRTAGLSVRPPSNGDIRDLFPASHVVYEVTTGWCSCDLFGRPSHKFDVTRDRRVYEKKGWSSAKIERALESKRLHRSRQHKPSLLGSLHAILETAPTVCLWAHWFGSGVHDAAVPVPTKIRRTLAEHDERGGVFPEDTLVLVHRGSA